MNHAVMTEIDLEKENKAIAQEYKLRISYQTLTTEDKKLIRKAFDVSVEAHKDQRRKSGEAYIFHPLLWQNRCFRNWFGRYLYCSCITS
jgi:GTP pyrophosphokinase